MILFQFYNGLGIVGLFQGLVRYVAADAHILFFKRNLPECTGRVIPAHG